MAAVIEHAFYRRMAIFLRRIRALSWPERAVGNAVVTVFFGVCQTPEYRAYLELHIASRTDADLRACFIDRARCFDRVWRDEVRTVFPEWANDARLELLSEYVCSVIEGLALNIDIWNDPARTDALLAFTAAAVRSYTQGNSPLQEDRRSTLLCFYGS